MKILIIGKRGDSLTGAGTYNANIVRELGRRHQVRVYTRQSDLEEEWDIAHCTDLKHLEFQVASRLRCPLVVDVHDYYWVRYYHFHCLDFPLRYLMQKYRRLRYHFLFRHIDGLILHGRYLYDLIEHPNKYLNFYFGLDYSGIAQAPWEEKGDLILFVGGDFFRKGLHRLLRALPEVLRRVPTARVMVIGKDHGYARAYARFLARGLPVTFCDGLQRDEVYRRYARGKVLVLPSEIEATPLVIAEALTAGIPPVVSAVGGHPELVQDGVTGFVFPLEDTGMLADRLVACLTDRALSERLVARGREFIGRFTIDGMMEQLESTYDDVRQRYARKRKS